jgi:hypothetical protein
MVEGVYWRFRSYLPFSLRTKFDSLILLRTPEEKQLGKIESLGKDIGLSSNEISAAYNPPLNLAHWRSRMTPFTICIMILGIVFVSFLILVLSSPSYPNPTYEFGTRYGTIRPDCFKSFKLGPIHLSENDSEFVMEELQ